MHDHVLINNLKQVPGWTTGRLSRLAMVALDRSNGPFDRLVGALQEKHGWNRERAAKELLRRIGKLRANQLNRTL